MKSKTKNTTSKLVLSGVFLALGIVLSIFAGNVKEIGMAFSPMHLPVLICGFLCGTPYGALVGALTPILKSLLTGMPALVPNALIMMFELAAYGAVAGFLSERFPKGLGWTYLSLLISMLVGRIVWGIAAFVTYTFFVSGPTVTLMFVVTQTVLSCIPGIIAQAVIVPPVVAAVRRVR